MVLQLDDIMDMTCEHLAIKFECDSNLFVKIGGLTEPIYTSDHEGVPSERNVGLIMSKISYDLDYVAFYCGEATNPNFFKVAAIFCKGEFVLPGELTMDQVKKTFPYNPDLHDKILFKYNDVK